MRIRKTSFEEKILNDNNMEKGNLYNYVHFQYTRLQESHKHLQVLSIQIAYSLSSERVKEVVNAFYHSMGYRKKVAEILNVTPSTITKHLQAFKKHVLFVYNWVYMFYQYHLSENKSADILKLKNKLSLKKCVLSSLEKEFILKLIKQNSKGSKYFLEKYINNIAGCVIASKYGVNNSTVTRGIASYKNQLTHILELYCICVKEWGLL